MSSAIYDDIVQQRIMAALEGMPANVPVSGPPGDATATTWVTFNEAGADSRTASNEARRVRHFIQLHAFTHAEDDEHRTAFFTALALLREAGVRVFSWGPDTYEQDTGVHHISCTCEWWQQ